MNPQRSNSVATPPAAAERIRELEKRIRWLESGLERRAVIECAKGILMERHDLGSREAFELLRRSARGSNQSVFDLAHVVVGARSLLPIRPRER